METLPGVVYLTDHLGRQTEYQHQKDDMQTDTPRLLSSPHSGVMLSSPISSWSHTPRRLQHDTLQENSSSEFSPLCEGLNTPLLSCLTLQPGTWGCNTATTPGSQLHSPPLATSDTIPLQPTPYLTSGLHNTTPSWVNKNDDPRSTGTCDRQAQCQKLEQQLQQSEAQCREHLQHLQAATASLQQKEQELAQLVDKQAIAQEQQEQLEQVQMLSWAAVQCCAMLCCAMQCCAVLCYAVLCYAVLCCGITLSQDTLQCRVLIHPAID